MSKWEREDECKPKVCVKSTSLCGGVLWWMVGTRYIGRETSKKKKKQKTHGESVVAKRIEKTLI